MSDLKIDLNGSAGHIVIKPGYSCGPANHGLLVELESDIPARQDHRSKLWCHGGVMSRPDMKKLRDLIDDELSNPPKKK